VAKVENHIPVLTEQVLHYLLTNRSGIYVDGSIGGAGHSVEILKQLNPDGLLVGIDWDDQALNIAEQRLKPFEGRFKIFKNNFTRIDEILSSLNIDQVDGILLDLGVSSFQIDSAERGFSYLNNGPLDMRMSNFTKKSAADLIETESLQGLTKIFREYGEERYSAAIARKIVAVRQNQPIITTLQLARVIESVVPHKFRLKTLARIFQAIRIATNLELSNLRTFLAKSITLLRSKSRLVIVSFHSLEDRMVKQFFHQAANPCECPAQLPYCICGKQPLLKILTPKVVRPTAEQIRRNPRCRSSRLRAAEII